MIYGSLKCSGSIELAGILGLGYMTPAAFAADCIPSASPMAQPQEYKTANIDNSLIKVST
jgi:hypothetical protein